ncbi:MAG: hypothetical protein LH606_11460 [Cytophagaceae bacterium]|nr:hypothetical protein [Cytophagaceae bacterium]
MTLLIELKDDLEQKIEAVALQEGKTVLELVENYLKALVEKKPASIFDRLVDLIGDVSVVPGGDDKKEYYEAMTQKHA